jgi:hypothetical protein
VTELDEPVGYVCGIKAEVFGAELFATSPVTDGGGDEHAPAADTIEEGGVLGTVIRVHNLMLGLGLVCVFRGKEKGGSGEGAALAGFGVNGGRRT